MRTANDPLGYYHSLDVAHDATPEEIKNAFRRAAKRFHPDQGGHDADEHRFQAVREAYNVLRDPAQRLAYDSDKLDDERERFSHTTYTLKKRDSKLVWAVPLLGGLLVLAVATAGFLAYRLDGRDNQVANLHARLAAAVDAEVAMANRLRAQNFQELDQALIADHGRSSVFQADISFSADTLELSGTGLDQLNDELLAMTAVIEQIPVGRDWVVMIESGVPRAAGDQGVSIEQWELGLLRLASIVEYVSAIGVPAERIAARFQAGFATTDGDPIKLNNVQLKLLCCLKY